MQIAGANPAIFLCNINYQLGIIWGYNWGHILKPYKSRACSILNISEDIAEGIAGRIKKDIAEDIAKEIALSLDFIGFVGNQGTAKDTAQDTAKDIAEDTQKKNIYFIHSYECILFV